MALTQDEIAALEKAGAMNGAPYDAQSNPGGLAGNGYKANWSRSMNDAATLTSAAVREASGAATAAAAQAAGSGAAAAATAADGARAESVAAQDAAQAGQTTAEQARDASLAARAGAENAGGAATAAWESLKSRYLGARAEDPTEGAPGVPLVPGMMVFNTTSGRFRGWTGEVWADLVGMGENGTLPAGDSAHRLAGYRLSADGSTVEYFRYALEPSPDPFVLSEPDIYTGMASFTVSGYPAGFGPARVQALGDVVLSVDDGVTWQPVAEADNGATVLVRPSAQPMVDRTTYVGTLQAGGVETDYSFFYRSLFVDTPSITSHGDGQVNVEDEPFFIASPYDVLPGEIKDGEHPHQDTDWQLYADAGLTELVWSTMGNASNKVQIQGPPLTEATTYYLRVRYRSATGLVSAWSDVVSFTTAVTFGPVLLTTDDGYKVYRHDVANVYSATTYYGKEDPQIVRMNMPYREGDRVLTLIKCLTLDVSSWIVVDTVRGKNKYLSCNNWEPQTENPDIFGGWTNGGVFVGVGDDVNAVDQLYQVQSFKESDRFFKIIEANHRGGVEDVIEVPSLGSIGMVWLKGVNPGSEPFWWIWHKYIPGGYPLLQWGEPYNVDFLSVSESTITLKSGLVSGNYMLYVWAHDEGPASIVRCGTYVGQDGAQEIPIGFPVQSVFVGETTAVSAHFFASAFGNLGAGPGPAAEMYYGRHAWYPETFFNEPTGLRTTTLPNNAVREPGYQYLYMAIRARGSVATDIPEQIYANLKYQGAGGKQVVDLGFMPDVYLWREPDTVSLLAVSSQAFGSDKQMRLPGSSWAAGLELYLPPSFNVGAGVLFTAGAYVTEGETFEVAGFSHHHGVFYSQTYTGTGAAQTVPHFLGSVPELMVLVNMSEGKHWVVYSPEVEISHILEFEKSDGAWEDLTIWNDSEPTATDFSVGTSAKVNASGIHYFCMMFGSRDGISKVGSFTTDASGNAIVSGLQFRPRFLLVKSVDAVGDWYISGITDAMTPTTAPGAEGVMTLNASYGLRHQLDWVDTFEDGFVIKQRTPSARHLFVALA